MVLSIRQYLRTVECCHPCLGSNFIPIDSKFWNFNYTIRFVIIARSRDRRIFEKNDLKYFQVLIFIANQMNQSQSDEGHIPYAYY